MNNNNQNNADDGGDSEQLDEDKSQQSNRDNQTEEPQQTEARQGDGPQQLGQGGMLEEGNDVVFNNDEELVYFLQEKIQKFKEKIVEIENYC